MRNLFITFPKLEFRTNLNGIHTFKAEVQSTQPLKRKGGPWYSESWVSHKAPLMSCAYLCDRPTEHLLSFLGLGGVGRWVSPAFIHITQDSSRSRSLALELPKLPLIGIHWVNPLSSHCHLPFWFLFFSPKFLPPPLSWQHSMSPPLLPDVSRSRTFCGILEIFPAPSSSWKSKLFSFLLVSAKEREGTNTGVQGYTEWGGRGFGWFSTSQMEVGFLLFGDCFQVYMFEITYSSHWQI